MTLSKQFMAWAIGLSKGRGLGHSATNPPGSLRMLSVKLLVSYLGAMVAVLGVSAISVYQFFAYSLFQEVDQQMLTVAEAAKHNFSAIQHDRRAAGQRFPNQIDNDGDLDLPWQDLRTAAQTVEWFDAAGTRLASVGKSIPNRPLFHPLFHLVPSRTSEGSRSVTLPIRGPLAAEQQPVLQGYVRVTMATQTVEVLLHRLWMGLSLGGAIALLAIGGTGWWLTRRSLHSIEQTLAKLQQFTADASHELRSPITAIKTAIDVIQSHPDRIHPADRRKLSIIMQANQQMQDLVENLLVLARMDNAVVQQTWISLPLHDILDDLVEDLQPQAIAADVQLQIKILEEGWVKGDAAQLRRVFLNLLDNAIYYTPAAGNIHITLHLRDTSTLTSPRKGVVVTVQDTGIGMSADQLPHVFSRFWRADEARSRKSGGSGLGLAIVNAIVATHHGSITVTSQVNVGSCFRVEFPSVKS